MKARIVFSSYDSLKNPYYAGGGALAVHKVAKALTKNYNVTIFTGKYPGCHDKKINRIQYCHIGITWLGPKLSQLAFQIALIYKAISEQYDLWIESFTPPFSTTCLPLFTKKPVIGLVHMLAGEDMQRKYKLPFIFFENLGLRSYQHFIVLTQKIKNRISAVNPKAQMYVVSNGVDVYALPTTKTHKNFILFLGRLEIDQKGLDILLESYKQTEDQVKQNLIIAGSGTKTEENRLRKMIHKLELQDRVILLGKVVGKEKRKLLRQASFIVIPSRFETFSVVALEALAYRLPIVGFTIDGLSWIPKDCCYLVKDFDKEALSQAIKTMGQDEKLRTAISHACEEGVKIFSWDLVVEKYKQIIKDVLVNKNYV
ncbi:glycosyltransferase family 4 protein [Candidatus Beckwithbacteria bacterium]|nr:glycosyltransferase family 4 protein [Candidatus Beckwithbacteria bacterium]